MQSITMPYSGRLLVSHLAAYGLAYLLDTVDIDCFVSHDPDSLSFEPIVHFEAEPHELADVVRQSAIETEGVIEADIDSTATGLDRRPVIWPRASFANDPDRAVKVQVMRSDLQGISEADGDICSQALLAGLGAPVTWGHDRLKPSHGATAYDGVLGNRTSDFVRGVLRWGRDGITEIDQREADLSWWNTTQNGTVDRTGWSPPGTKVDPLYQWLAAFGLAVTPVGHRADDRSQTPTAWFDQASRSGVALPLVRYPASVSRLRAILALRSLVEAGKPNAEGSPQHLRATGELRSLGISEVVRFERQYAASAGNSIAFTFARAERVDLR